MRVFILGAGKVGANLAQGLRKAGWNVALRSARAGLPERPIVASLLVLAVRDGQLGAIAEALVARRLVSARTACVHVAGSLGPDAIAALRPSTAGVAQMHPMISFADPHFSPGLAKGNLHLCGDATAVRRGRAVARALGMTARTIPELDLVAYHAAAGLVANGAGALAAVGASLLERAGVSRTDAPRLLGPLLRSVADNIEAIGFPRALTGPVRRGDAAAVKRHLAVLQEKLPGAAPLFVASALAQLPLAREIGEAEAASFDAIESLLTAGGKQASGRERTPAST